jgi:predicted nucleic acid-binding protein
MIIADAGPIIAFARIGRLDLLHQVVGELVIPDAVSEELVRRGRERPGAAEVEGGVWIHRHTVKDRAAVALLPPVLHLGEREAIVLAEELHGRLLIDEQRGRHIAMARGLEVFGSLRILAEAKQLGLIDRVTPMVEAMRASGYWVDEETLVPFFREIGEGSPPVR